ncbi:hypothetical protein MRB53_037944 [Persea americana]|nr:hypothetical protein MRB53_037944 [Persea americana]
MERHRHVHQDREETQDVTTEQQQPHLPSLEATGATAHPARSSFRQKEVVAHAPGRSFPHDDDGRSTIIEGITEDKSSFSLHDETRAKTGQDLAPGSSTTIPDGWPLRDEPRTPTASTRKDQERTGRNGEHGFASGRDSLASNATSTSPIQSLPKASKSSRIVPLEEAPEVINKKPHAQPDISATFASRFASVHDENLSPRMSMQSERSRRPASHGFSSPSPYTGRASKMAFQTAVDDHAVTSPRASSTYSERPQDVELLASPVSMTQSTSFPSNQSQPKIVEGPYVPPSSGGRSMYGSYHGHAGDDPARPTTATREARRLRKTKNRDSVMTGLSISSTDGTQEKRSGEDEKCKVM